MACCIMLKSGCTVAAHNEQTSFFFDAHTVAESSKTSVFIQIARCYESFVVFTAEICDLKTLKQKRKEKKFQREWTS